MKVFQIYKHLAVCVAILAMNMSHAHSAEKFTILAFGDSLTAGYGLKEDQGFTKQLEQELGSQGLDVTVINAGVSGDTSSGGLSRLEWLISGPQKPDLFILELGANDALRGITPAITRANLDKILAKLQQAEINTLMAGMLAPPNMGGQYGEEFNKIYPELAEKYNISLYPFFLDGVAGNATFNQDDGMHPNADGVAIIVKNIIPFIIKSLP